MALSTVEAAIDAFRAGRMVVVVDSDDRENEGDVCIPAGLVTSEHVNFMARHARGLVCLALSGSKVDALGLAPMVERNGCSHGTAFTVSIEARTGVTTGISAADRALTIQVASAAGATDADIVSPGHIFPLRARDGGVLERAGHTEASVELAALAGLEPAAVICEIMNDDGTMARQPDLVRFCEEHDMLMISVEQLVEYQAARRTTVRRVAETRLPSRHGEFRLYGFEGVDGAEHLALVRGDVAEARNVLVRAHSACVTGDVFGSGRCDCGDQLDAALAAIDEAGCGVLLYLDQEGRGIGLLNKVRAYALQDDGLDTVDANHALGFEADLRSYDAAVEMLADLGVESVRLLTNNPEKLDALTRAGINVVDRVPLVTVVGDDNRQYLDTKRERFGHLLGGPRLAPMPIVSGPLQATVATDRSAACSLPA